MIKKLSTLPFYKSYYETDIREDKLEVQYSLFGRATIPWKLDCDVSRHDALKIFGLGKRHKNENLGWLKTFATLLLTISIFLAVAGLFELYWSLPYGGNFNLSKVLFLAQFISFILVFLFNSLAQIHLVEMEKELKEFETLRSCSDEYMHVKQTKPNDVIRALGFLDEVPHALFAFLFMLGL